MVDTCRALGVEADRRDGPPGLLGRPGRAAAAQDRRARAAGRARRQLPRDRPQRDRRPGRLRAHRRLRDARRRVDVDRPRARPARRAAVDRRASRPPAGCSPPPWHDRLAGARLTGWPPACSSCARTRSPAGGSRPSSTGRSIATASGWPRRRSTTAATARTAASRPATGSACGRSRTSPSTSSGPRTRPVASSATSPRSRSSRPASSGSWRTVVAPPREHRPLQAVGERDRRRDAPDLPRRRSPRRRPPARPPTSRSSRTGAPRPGARTNHLCLDLYDLPQVPHRVAEEIGGAARFVIREGECPFCRLVRDEPKLGERLVWEDAASVAFAPFASRSPFEVWIVPRRHAADFGEASDADVAATAEALRQVLGRLAGLDGPPYNLVLHTAPLGERVDATYHWHWEIHPRLREIAGLELGHRVAGQPGLAGGGRRGAPAHRGRRAPRLADGASVTRGRRGRRLSAVHPTGQLALAPDRAMTDALGPHGRRRVHRGAVRPPPRRDLRLPVPDGPRPRAGRRHDPGRLRQGLPQLRLARGSDPRPGLAVPDRPPRRARRVPPAQDRPVHALDGRVARLRAVGRAPRDGRPAVRAAPARARPDPRAPARRAPPGRAPRPDRARARRRARGQPRRGTGAPDPGPREPAPGARRRAGRRGRGRGRCDGRNGRRPPSGRSGAAG